MGGGKTVYAVQGNYIKSADPGLRSKHKFHLIDAKCRWRSNRLDVAVSFKEPFGHVICCLAAQFIRNSLLS